MTKQHIISEIIRTTKENNSKPLGSVRFEHETGIKQADWLGRYWRTWGDALIEAGYQPNKMQEALDKGFLIDKVIALIKELGRFPTKPDLKLKRRSDSSFPNHDTFRRRLGKKHEIAGKILEYCESQEGLTAVADICRPICKSGGTEAKEGDTQKDEVEFGFVYLIKSGRYYKIGRSLCPEKRNYEINLLLPEKAKLIHKIKTDDPVGIEVYWHKRFEAKRKRGEWFDLSASDVKAFKRRRSFM